MKNPQSNIELNDFRDSFNKLYVCDHLVVDKKNRWAGIYIGWCLAHNHSVITVGLPPGTYHGVTEYTRSGWREFAKEVHTLGTVGIPEFSTENADFGV